MLCRLIYASDVATPFDFGDLQAILAKAQQNNPALAITGLMNQQLRTLLASKYGTDERGNLVVPDQPFTATSFLFDVAHAHGMDAEA
jgi:hypothetical protein